MKHILDRPKTVTDARVKRSMAIALQGQPNTASLRLQRRIRGRWAKPRVMHYHRIVRGLA